MHAYFWVIFKGNRLLVNSLALKHSPALRLAKKKK
jgi:hypothetical protein